MGNLNVLCLSALNVIALFINAIIELMIVGMEDDDFNLVDRGSFENMYKRFESNKENLCVNVFH